MTTRTIICRDHGGRLTYEAKRGRQPVRCKPELPCDRAKVTEVAETVEETSNGKVDFHSMTNPELKAYAREHYSTIGKITSREQMIAALEKQESKSTPTPVVVPPAESNGHRSESTNPSLLLAKAAKLQLEAVGWTVAGKAWAEWPDEPDDGNSVPALCASLNASRGAETLVMEWRDARISDQQYSMHYEHPAANAIPPNKLGFDPEELTDRELVDRIRGMKVVWWNTLGNSTESGTIGNKVSVEHVFDDNTAKRLVKFIDHGGQGFRAFHVSALLKVG